MWQFLKIATTGFFCNGIEQCVGGYCQPGTAPGCSDNTECTVDTCDAVSFDSCSNTPNDSLCNSGHCHQNNGCTCYGGEQQTAPDEALRSNLHGPNRPVNSCSNPKAII